MHPDKPASDNPTSEPKKEWRAPQLKVLDIPNHTLTGPNTANQEDVMFYKPVTVS